MCESISEEVRKKLYQTQHERERPDLKLNTPFLPKFTTFGNPYGTATRVQNRVDSVFGSSDRSKLNNMSISELVSELRDTFLKSDFDRVEETLVAREALMKAEIAEKNREIGLLKENLQLERLDKINIELELKRVKGERGEEELVKVGENGNGFCLDDGKVVKAEMGCEINKLEVLKNRGFGNGDASAVAELEVEKVEVLAEKKRLVGEPSKKDGLCSSGQRLGIGTVIDIGDSDEDERNSQETLHRKETTSCVIADTKRQSSSGAVQKNLATKLAKPIGITQRDDFDRVEETLVAREVMLKAEIEEKMREIGSLQEKNQFKSFERLNFEIELKTVRGERCGEELVKVGENGNGFGLDDGKVVKAELGHERCMLEVFNNRGVGDGDASAVAEVEGEKVEVLAEKKKMVGEPRKKDGLGASGGRLGIGTVIDIEDSDEDECNSQAPLFRKATTTCVIADNERKSSSAAVQKNLATRLAEPLGILKRELASSREIGTNINILDCLDSDISSCSSSSSSSSGEFEMDSFPLESLTSNKKMRTNATNLVLNS